MRSGIIGLSLLVALFSFSRFALAANEFKNQTTSKQNSKEIKGKSTVKKDQQFEIKRNNESYKKRPGDIGKKARDRDAVGSSINREYRMEKKEESPKPNRHIITDEDDVRRR